MSIKINRPAQETAGLLEEALREAFPEAEIAVDGMGGHFEIRVISEVFEGQRTLARQRLVLKAIAHLMAGENAPVHAVDRIVARPPEAEAE